MKLTAISLSSWAPDSGRPSARCRGAFSLPIYLGLSLLATSWSLPSVAQGIISMEIAPGPLIRPTNEVSFTIQVGTPNEAAQLYRPTEVVIGASQVLIVLYVTWGDAPAVDYLVEKVPVGRLPVGVYEYAVVLKPQKAGLPWYGELFQTGTFVVQPTLTAHRTPEGRVFLMWEWGPSRSFVLETAPDLSAGAQWQPVENVVDPGGGYQYVELDPTGPTGFFRLVPRPRAPAN